MLPSGADPIVAANTMDCPPNGERETRTETRTGARHASTRVDRHARADKPAQVCCAQPRQASFDSARELLRCLAHRVGTSSSSGHRPRQWIPIAAAATTGQSSWAARIALPRRMFLAKAAATRRFSWEARARLSLGRYCCQRCCQRKAAKKTLRWMRMAVLQAPARGGRGLQSASGLGCGALCRSSARS